MIEIINFSTVYVRRKRGWHPRSIDCWKTCCHQTKMKTRPQDLSRTPPSQLPSQRCSVSQVTVDAELGPQQSNAEHSAPHLVKDPLTSISAVRWSSSRMYTHLHAPCCLQALQRLPQSCRGQQLHRHLPRQVHQWYQHPVLSFLITLRSAG